MIQSDLDEVDFNYDLLGNPNGSGYVTNVLNQLLESPSYEYAYDVRGNLIQQLNKLNSKVMNFTWSIDNRLMQVEIKNNGADLSGRVAFGYDALGRRISKTWQDFSNPQNSYAKTFIYDREDLVMEVENEKITAFYVHAPGIDNPIAVLRDLNNNQEFNDDEVFFYTKDHLGSIRELIGLDGKLKQRQRYTAYGVTTREKNTDEMDRLIDHAYGFTGRELDSETGLYFYRSRYYSPEMQRFVSEDTIGFAGDDANLYRYVGSNPFLYNDPFGFCRSFFDNFKDNYSLLNQMTGFDFGLTDLSAELLGLPFDLATSDDLAADAVGIGVGQAVGQSLGLTASSFRYLKAAWFASKFNVVTASRMARLRFIGGAALRANLITFGVVQTGFGLGAFLRASVDSLSGDDCGCK